MDVEVVMMSAGDEDCCAWQIARVIKTMAAKAERILWEGARPGTAQAFDEPMRFTCKPVR